jgi:dolichyl-phosphate beta-glucosyltransferase
MVAIKTRPQFNSSRAECARKPRSIITGTADRSGRSPGSIRTIGLSLVIPAYNEASRIGRCIDTVAQFLAKDPRRSEVIVVNDGSKDNTAELTREKIAAFDNFRLLELPENRGKGAAVREGILASNGDRVLMMDADLATPLDQLKKLDSALDEGFDIAVGSRQLPGSVLVKRQPWRRQLAGLSFGTVVRTLLPINIKDTQCGFKLFKGNAARDLFGHLSIDGFAFDVEIVTMAIVRGLSIKEVPVVWSDAGESKVSVIGHLPAVIKEILDVRHRWKTGIYSR